MRIVTLPSLSDVSMMTTCVAIGASDSPISVIGKNKSDSILDLFLFTLNCALVSVLSHAGSASFVKERCLWPEI